MGCLDGGTSDWESFAIVYLCHLHNTSHLDLGTKGPMGIAIYATNLTKGIIAMLPTIIANPWGL